MSDIYYNFSKIFYSYDDEFDVVTYNIADTSNCFGHEELGHTTIFRDLDTNAICGIVVMNCSELLGDHAFTEELNQLHILEDQEGYVVKRMLTDIRDKRFKV